MEALNIIKGMKQRSGGALRCFLAAGFNPLHLRSFLAAELGLLHPEKWVEVVEGLYGDLLGNLVRLADANSEFGVVLIEWSDLDPRLGLRCAARWGPSELTDIATTARERARHIHLALADACQRTPLVVSLPTLPLPPLSVVPEWQAGPFELDLTSIVQSLAARATGLSQCRLLSPQRIAWISPLERRHDIDSEVLTGFPYSLSHASALASSLARLAQLRAPKKGLITDLDNTLWKGIVGEDGVTGVSWDLDHQSQMHAIYQRFLGALASEGALIGVASKNDPHLVAEALSRDDLALSASALFPVEANWGAKSRSITRILKIWNIGAESVVFVDDSALELSEVKAAHPQIECLQFPSRKPAAVNDLLSTLRDLFGKDMVLEEDRIRATSIRNSREPANERDTSASLVPEYEHVEDLRAEIKCTFGKLPADPRALELVNKTNQFNLNGRRYTEASWNNYLRDHMSVLLVASYTDKFGPLGKVAVLAGRRVDRRLIVNAWVMSCRAFSRRIEYRSLAELIARDDIAEIQFDYERTDRNGPLTECLTWLLGITPTPGCVVSREALEIRLRMLSEIKEVVHE